MTGRNWGRWGADDERGTLNLLTPEAVLAATQVCRTGKVYSLALPIQREGVPIFDYRGAPQRLSLTSTTDNDRYEVFGAPEGLGSNEDVLVLASHSITHMDALSHVFAEGRMYNDFGAEEFTTARGAQHLDVAQTASFAGRGVLLDLPRHQGVDWLEPGHVIDAAATRSVSRRAGRRAAQRRHPPRPHRLARLLRHRRVRLARSLASAWMRCRSSTTTTSRWSAPTTPPSSASRSTTTISSASTSSCWSNRGVTLLEHLFLAELAADGCHEFLLSVGGLKVTRRGREPDQSDRDRLTTSPGGDVLGLAGIGVGR